MSTPWVGIFNSTPVIDRDYIEDVVTAFFEAIRRFPGIPKLIQLLWIQADSPAYIEMRRQLGRWHCREYERDERPMVDIWIGLRTGRNLNRSWKRLTALPAEVRIVNERWSPAAVVEAFEVFLKMELAQWKGDEGTAVLSKPMDALFARNMVANLAKTGSVSVPMLKVGNDVLAARVVLYCGRTAYTWKTAYDSRFAEYSPGSVLAVKFAETLLAGGETTMIDSCSSSHSNLARLWDGRYPIIDDAIIDVHLYFSPSLLREIITWEMHRIHRRISMRIWPAIKQKFVSLGWRTDDSLRTEAIGVIPR
jgi:hypothetical protein